MTPDDYLEKLLDAMHNNNYVEAESLARKLLNSPHLLNPTLKEELTSYLSYIIEESAIQKEKQAHKEKLIEEIMNFNKNTNI